MTALALALLLALPGGEDLEPADLDLAERAYAAGRYGDAYDLLRTALPEDPAAAAGALLYNLGNCAFRLERHAEALHHYRRAERRLPRDSEVRYNRRLAEQQLGLDEGGDAPPGAALWSWTEAFTAGELLLLVVVLELVGLAGWLLPRRRRRLARLGAALALMLALLGGARLVQSQWFAGPPEGIVLARAIRLHTEPHAEMPVVLELKAGASVRIEQQSDRWVRVRHPQGSGWVEADAVGVID